VGVGVEQLLEGDAGGTSPALTVRRHRRDPPSPPRSMVTVEVS
jgi:hypothetical protein